MTANEEMIELWNSDAAAAWVTHSERYDVMLAPFGEAALAAGGCCSGEGVLDVGCGAGAVTVAAARAVGGTGRAVGVDISRQLIEHSRRRAAAEGVENAEFHELDAQSSQPPGGPFDLVISRFGVMFFEDPVAAFANLRGATAPNGRLSFACWQGLGENEWSSTAVFAAIPHVGMPDIPPPDAPGPFAFADPDRVRSILAEAGWSDVGIDELRTEIHVGGAATPEEAATYFREDVFGHVLFAKADEAARQAATDAITAAFAEHVKDGAVRLGAAAWVVTATNA